ncbi:hypothetical protein ACFFJY_01955 [Fictibacillus aquaticus]|uniref:Uncharacterized protein n=1 Tax=Fictibacillus aquaticus TaxID=2021314 RepID=A0A235F9T1_9BACL|nr:hypothetical protein [Fictibacillus aquaticus]OYD57475.1 hypothetical protein CGZ90_12420 [Fictibacillus aquaticus]
MSKSLLMKIGASLMAMFLITACGNAEEKKEEETGTEQSQDQDTQDEETSADEDSSTEQEGQ